MAAASLLESGVAGRRRRRFAAVSTCVLALCVLAAGGSKQHEPTGAPAELAPAKPGGGHRSGRLIRIPLPITGSVDARVKRMADEVLADLPKHGPRPVLIFEFWPQQSGAGEGSQFERSLSLARYLASDRLSRARIVAYLPRSVKGHAVLVAMACEEIIMHPDAEFGQAGIDETSIDPTIRRGYTEIADRFRTIPAAVALGMLDKRLLVYKVETAGGTRYVLSDELDRLKQQTAVKTIDTMIPAEEMGRFTGRELRLKYGFVTRLVGSRSELARALSLPSRAIEQDPSLGSKWEPIQIALKGATGSQATRRVQRSIEDSLRTRDVNFICLWIESPGGAPRDSVTLANFLADLDSSHVRTVAYIPDEARADAALVALACDHAVLHEDAILGGPGAYHMDDENVLDMRETIRDIARRKSRSWSLIAAMIDPNLTVHRYTLRGSDISEYFCQEELASQVDPASWEKGRQETTPGQPYRVEGLRAEKVGLARYVVANFDEFKTLYHLEDDPALVQPGWAEELIDALASPELASLLLFVGGFALIAEIMSPGIGAGGFIASVCYLLFFWSQFLHGTATWLEALLFLAGIAFVALEILVLPGFGIFGLGGGVMIIVALVLASQTTVQIPQNAYQWG